MNYYQRMQEPPMIPSLTQYLLDMIKAMPPAAPKRNPNPKRQGKSLYSHIMRGMSYAKNNNELEPVQSHIKELWMRFPAIIRMTAKEFPLVAENHKIRDVHDKDYKLFSTACSKAAEEARAAVPDILRRCEESPAETLEPYEQKTFFPEVPDSEPDFTTPAVKRVFPFPHLSENPNRAELYGRFFSLFLTSRSHKVDEGDLLRAKPIQTSPSVQARVRGILKDFVERGFISRNIGPRGFSYTLNLDVLEGTNETPVDHR